MLDSLVPLHTERTVLCQSIVTLGLRFLLLFGQCLCLFPDLLFDSIGEGLPDTLVRGFQFGIFLFDGCVLSFVQKVGNTGFYAVRVLPVGFPYPFLLIGYLAVKFSTAPLPFLVPSLQFSCSVLVLSASQTVASLSAWACSVPLDKILTPRSEKNPRFARLIVFLCYICIILSCTRKNKSKLYLRSFAKYLHNGDDEIQSDNVHYGKFLRTYLFVDFEKFGNFLTESP